jgi:hypothetical protein
VEVVVGVAYTRDWELIADALKRVMATGVSEDEAKTDLCGAVADGKIALRVRIATSGQLFTGGNVSVPPQLTPGDLDWAQSRPLGPWPIGPRRGEHYSWIRGWENRPIDLIELSTADVVEILCCAEDKETLSAIPEHESAAIKALAFHLGSHPGLTRADAKAWCHDSGYSLGNRAFERVWPQAREKANLGRIAKPGRKPKSPR